MPTYEYLCKTCGHRFETWQKMTDEPLITCPQCGAQIHRVLFPAGIVFKGSGFYKTDHRNGANGASAKEETKASDGTKSEAPAAKSEGTSTESSSSSATTSESKAPATTNAA